MTQTDKGQFVQFPIHLIYGCPDLNRDDKWVLLAIMGRCWSEGPQRLSYRDIAAISGVPLSLISSFKDKNDKVHEGIVDRLVRLNFLRIIIGKEVNPSTGSVKGQAQSYVYVNYAYIWQMNVAYCNSRKSAQEEFKVTENDFASVSHTNTSNTESVSYTNASVPIENAPVSNANASVSHTNKSVSSASTKPDPYITVDNIDTTDNIDREREVATATARSQSSSQEISQDDEDTVKKEVVDGRVDKHPVVDRDLPANSHQPKPSQPVLRQDTNKVTHPPAPRKPPSNKTIPEPELTPDEQAVFDAWCSLFKVAVPLIPANAKACKQLAKPLQVWTGILHESTAQVLKRIMNWAYKNDKNGYYKRGFKLYDAAREFEGWQSAQERPQGDKDESNEHKATQQPANAFIERCLDKDYNKRKLEEMREKNALKRQAQAVKGV